MLDRLIRKIAFLAGYEVHKYMSKDERALLAIGAMLSKQQFSMTSTNINDYEFRIFSQHGDDGIIQYLIRNVEIKNEIFIEFGVEDYLESNTRFLMMNNNWVGFVMDGSSGAMESLTKREWYWKYQLTQKAAFVDRENINPLMESTGFSEIGLLHIDIDGNDYHVLEAMDLSRLNPSIVIMEYNSVFGSERKITVPYDKDFDRTRAHYSNLFFGASLSALNDLAVKKGYAFVGSNLAGNNAFFVRRDLLNPRVRELSVEQGYRDSRFRESRNRDFKYDYMTGKDRLELLRGLEVLNVESNRLEKL